MVAEANWTDDPCYYVSVVDGERYALLAGPFRTHEEALAHLGCAREHAYSVDPRAWWYAYGTCKCPNGHRAGILNKALEEVRHGN